MMREGNIDFGDQIVLALRLLRARPHVLSFYQRRFKYVLVDEFQDTNHAQFELVKLLAARHRNVAVVADDDQCLRPGALIETPNGRRPIEEIKVGDEVITAVGKAAAGVSTVMRTFRRDVAKTFRTFHLESGTSVTTTDNHKMFCYVPRREASRTFTYVYLMERKEFGWRIGVTNDLATRLCLERSADRIIAVRACANEAEARYYETLWSLKFGIPTIPFKPRDGVMIVGPYLDRLFNDIDTRKAAESLAAELGIDLDAHHFALGGVHRGGQSRAKIRVAICYRQYASKGGDRLMRAAQILHKVQLETSIPETVERLQRAGIRMSRTRRGWQISMCSASLEEAGQRADMLREISGGIVEFRFVVGRIGQKYKAALVMPAANVMPGHYLPVLRGHRIRYERIVRITEEFTRSAVYDLEVARTHNFIADGVVVHNSIYKWRGAAIANVLGFLGHYADARRIVLTENFRSHQAILDAAYRLIQHNNPDRLEVQSGIAKHLTAVGEMAGPEPQHWHFETATQEADRVAQAIREHVEQGAWKLNDVAILVRSNDDADPFLRSLNLRGIPWTFSGNAGLYGRPEVRLLLAFLRGVAHPDDSVSIHYLASSDLYGVPIVDLTRCSTHADRKHRWLFDVLKESQTIPELAGELSEEARLAIRHLVTDLARYMELGREMATGELLYQFLVDSGWLARMSKAATARDEAEVQNISKFFQRILDASKVLKYDNIREFVKHLDALIEAGEDPAVAEADVETPAVRVLTVHKAKGLEFPVVFLVRLVQGRFPTPKRRDALELPADLIKDPLPAGDFHMQEERRLFYVGMTRARRELFLTSARDYGGARERKVSQFVLEALDLPKEAARPFKGRAVEELERFAPSPVQADDPLPPMAQDEPLVLSHRQVDDYQTCPLKYRYVHLLRVPILRHHTVVYGSTIHAVVEFYLKRRVEGNYTSLDDLLAEYDRKWVNHGFLTWEHQEARKAAGREALIRFWQQEEAEGTRPTYIEKDFSFGVGPNRVRGRFDRVDEDLLGAVIIDYKTSEITRQTNADRRVAASLQLKMYALAWREMTGILPQRVELRFIESQVTGRHTPTDADADTAIEAVRTAADGIRARRFDATPSRQACRYCAYSQICPFTATRE
jgi:DNA helicase-2/ATP-dependent DNA helicase PcrA